MVVLGQLLFLKRLRMVFKVLDRGLRKPLTQHHKQGHYFLPNLEYNFGHISMRVKWYVTEKITSRRGKILRILQILRKVPIYLEVRWNHGTSPSVFLTFSSFSDKFWANFGFQNKSTNPARRKAQRVRSDGHGLYSFTLDGPGFLVFFGSREELTASGYAIFFPLWIGKSIVPSSE